MATIGVLLLAAATATGGIGKPHANKHWLKPHVVQEGVAPAGGPSACLFGHPGCGGGGGCPGAGGGPGGPGGAGMPGQPGRRFPNVRSQVYFVDPPGMRIGWQTTAGGPERVYLPGQLSVPARYNFMQGYIYRLKLTDIPGRPNLQLYPTIEVAPSTPATDAYLTHNPIPAQFTEEDFDQVTAGNFVTKVIYLPDPRYQELAIAGVETLVSTRLEPGVDPVLEADRRGTILMIIRMGAIDLEMPGTGSTNVVIQPGMNVPPGAVVDPNMYQVPGTTTYPPSGTVLPPGTLPPGTVYGSPVQTESVPVDNAPVSPAAPGPFTPPPPTPSPEPSTTEPSAPEMPSPELPAPGFEVPEPGAEAPTVEAPEPMPSLNP